MAKSRGSLSLINERNSAELLIMIVDRGEIIADDLRDIRGSYDRLWKLIERMERNGLVTVEIQRTPFQRYTIKPTDKGVYAAELAKAVDNLFGF